jgi:trimeric autotransporter adhesin
MASRAAESKAAVVGLAAVSAALTTVACAADTTLKHRCVADPDCASGRVCSQGTCRSRPTPDSGSDAAGSASTRPNYMFVTSQRFDLRLQPLDRADAHCSGAAADAGLPGDYRAWLSTNDVHARDRLGRARGWIRVDGAPFADTVDDLVAGRIFNPPSVNERGQALSTNDVDLVATGTNPFGYNMPGVNCHNWKLDEPERAVAGDPHGTTNSWTEGTEGSEIDCFVPRRLYCFGVDQERPVRPAEVPALGSKRAFLSDGLFRPGGGLAAADALCAAEAFEAGLPGSFLALLPAAGASAAARFDDAAGATWFRIDGAPIHAPGSDLFSGAPLVTSLNVTSKGRYIGVPRRYGHMQWVFTGSETPRSSASTCQDWTDDSGLLVATYGSIAHVARWWLEAPSSGVSCSFALRIYCLER